MLILDQFNTKFIYSFEPVSTTFQFLRDHITNKKNVYVINSALGDKIGKIKMHATPLYGGNGILMNDHKNNNFIDEIEEVEINTIDNFCNMNNITFIDLLKVDTEGYELFVLKGAKQILNKNKVGYIFLECDFQKRHGEPHGDFLAIYEFLQPLGYEVVSFYSSGVDELGWVWGNVLFKNVKYKTRQKVTVTPFKKN